MPNGKRSVIIAGGRNFGTTDPENRRFGKFDEDRKFLHASVFPLFTDYHDEYWMPHSNLEIVSGTAPGADRLGEDWAMANWVPIKQFPADWDKYGKRAGHLRNRQMAEYADELVAFWDGWSRGTENMIQTMLTYHKPVHVFFYE